MKKVFTAVLSMMIVFSGVCIPLYAEEEQGITEPVGSEIPIVFCDNCGSQLYVFHTTTTHYWMRCPNGCMGDDWVEVHR